MTRLRLISFGYAIILGLAASLNYIPGVADENGVVFGIFALDSFDDALHIFSGLWAFTACYISQSATRKFLLIFGSLYLGDGIFGFFTGFGYLDFGIFTNELLGFTFTSGRILANLPHIILGAFALWANRKWPNL